MRRVSTRKGAARKNLSMFLMADGEAALFGLPKERVEIEGTLMGTSAGRRTVVDSAALACYGVSASRTLMTSVATARLNHSAPLRPTNPLVSQCPFPSALFSHVFADSIVLRAIPVTSLELRGIQPSMILLPRWHNLSRHLPSRPRKCIFYQILPIFTHG
jgi:hypothetical protein